MLCLRAFFTCPCPCIYKMCYDRLEARRRQRQRLHRKYLFSLGFHSTEGKHSACTIRTHCQRDVRKTGEKNASKRQLEWSVETQWSKRIMWHWDRREYFTIYSTVYRFFLSWGEWGCLTAELKDVQNAVRPPMVCLSSVDAVQTPVGTLYLYMCVLGKSISTVASQE